MTKIAPHGKRFDIWRLRENGQFEFRIPPNASAQRSSNKNDAKE